MLPQGAAYDNARSLKRSQYLEANGGCHTGIVPEMATMLGTGQGCPGRQQLERKVTIFKRLLWALEQRTK